MVSPRVLVSGRGISRRLVAIGDAVICVFVCFRLCLALSAFL